MDVERDYLSTLSAFERVALINRSDARMTSSASIARAAITKVGLVLEDTERKLNECITVETSSAGLTVMGISEMKACADNVIEEANKALSMETPAPKAARQLEERDAEKEPCMDK